MNKSYKPGMAGDAVAIRIYSRYQPHVLAGDELTVSLEQTVDGHIKADDALAVNLVVEGPHERLAETDIVGRYPAPGTDSSPDEFLPHIALSRRSLPWERLRTKGNPGSTPWVALLLFKISELSQGGPKSTKVKSLQAQHPDFYTKLKGLKYGDDTQLDLVWVGEPRLKEVLPTQDELPLLSHVQRLALDVPPPDPDELDPMWKLDDDATVAIVIGNRLPDATGPGKPEEHIACLVSLEDRGDLPWPTAADRKAYVVPQSVMHAAVGTAALSTPSVAHPVAVARPVITTTAAHVGIDVGVSAAPVGGIAAALVKQVPLVVLHSWRFTPSTSGDFEQVVKAIRFAPNGGVLCFGGLPSTPGHPTPTTLTADGYLTLDTPAEPTGKAYYRGPLTPLEVGRKSTIAIRAAPSELQDPAHPEKLDDYSYAAAFELGRLLTLADDGLLSDLQSIRRTLVPPVMDEVLAIDPRPDCIAKKDWVVNPNPEESVILPASHTDYSGIADYKAQLDVPQLMKDLGATVATPQIDQAIDIDQVAVAELDAKFAQLVTHSQSGRG